MVCHKKILVVLFVLLEASLAPCAAVAFENGRIVVKGKLVFDAGGAAFAMTGRGVTFGRGAVRGRHRDAYREHR